MARKKINYYVFTPGVANAGTVKMQNNHSLDDILMITNVTKNIVIYNFGDPNRGGSVSFNSGTDSSFPTAQNGITTLTLKFDTSSMSSTDVLQIYVETVEQRIRTHDFGIDAVERQRVGMPRSMIDADFEYGLQTTKWAGYSTWRHFPTTYEQAGTDFFANTFGYVTMITGAVGGYSNISPTGTNTGSTQLNASTQLVPFGAQNSVVQVNVINQGNSYVVTGNLTPYTAPSNLGFTGALSPYWNTVPGNQRIDTSPSWFTGDYYMLVRQSGGFAGTGSEQTKTQAGIDSYVAANAVMVSNTQPITMSNGGPFQRTFTVNDTRNYYPGDIISVIGLPTYDGTTLANVGNIGVAASWAGTATANVITITSTSNMPATAANATIAVEVGSINSGVYELMIVTSTGAAAFSAVRYVNGTNPSNAAPASNGRIYMIGSNSAIETMRIDSVDSVANTFTVTRGWFGANANATFAAGSIVTKLNTYGNTLANIEFVRFDANAAGVQTGTVNSARLGVLHMGGNAYAGFGPGTQGGPYQYNTPVSFTRQFGPNSATSLGLTGGLGRSFGTMPLSSAISGTYVIKLTGMFAAGNTSMPLAVLNANVHGIMWGGNANANAFVSTIGVTGSLNNANVEGIFVNQINDTNYLAFKPKVAEGDFTSGGPWAKHPGYPLLPFDTQTRFRKAQAFTGANVLLQANSYVINSDELNPSTITVFTNQPHGLVPGVPLQVKMFASNNINYFGNHDVYGSGIFVVGNVANNTSFSYTVTGPVYNSKNLAVTPIVIPRANITVFPTSLVKHRPLDGGTNIGINSPVWGFEATRQSRKYFRYQSGKGMMFTTGTQFNPVYSVSNIAANGTTTGSGITIYTINDHGVQRGATVQLYNVQTSGYNGTYYVNNVNSTLSFTVLATSALGAQQPVFKGNASTDIQTAPRVVVTNWAGAKVRAGMYDDANGMFWEYDGQYLWAVKRSATYDGVGLVSIQAGDNRVVGDQNTRFQDTLKVGDDIQIRGMVHNVISITSQNVMYISPAFRAAQNAFGVAFSIVREVRTRSANFNLDRLDGTGPSGYVINLAKMQMVAIQYTWYGAGFIDWGMRTKDGQMIWAHRVKNNNINDEGYMRTGNLPARYQAVNRGVIDQLAVALTATEIGNIQVYNGVEFPPATIQFPQTLIVDNELITYYANYNFANGQANLGANVFSATGTVGTVSGAGTTGSPWTYTLTLGTAVTIGAGTPVYATPGTGSIYSGLASAAYVASAVTNSTTLTVNVLGGTTPVAGDVTNVQVPMLRGNANVGSVSLPYVSNYPHYFLGVNRVLGGSANVAHAQGAHAQVFGITSSPDLNHWGSAVILDGDFDIDRTYSFTYSITNMTVAAQAGPSQINGGNTPQTLFMIRLAPSIGSGLPGSLGQKDVINRAQLLLQNMYINLSSTSGRALLQGIVNPTNIAAANWQPVNTSVTAFQPSFSQFVANTALNVPINSAQSQITWAPVINNPSVAGLGVPTAAAGAPVVLPYATGGEQLFSIPISGTNSGFIDLSKVKEIGGTIVPGDQVYPNGPEVVAFNIVPIGATFSTAANVDLQLTWIESQA